MSKLVIDMTPLVINRTAMYFIVRDTVRHLILSGAPVELQALGEPVDLVEFVANDFTLRSSFETVVRNKLGRALENPAAFGDSSKPTANSDSVNLVFDPLYLLFMPPARRTIAYVLDLTAISRPQWHNDRVSRLYATAFDRLYDPSIDIVSISESTSRDLWANYGIPRTRVRVVPLYNRFSHLEAGVRTPLKQFLFVGSLEVRKNIVGLAKGFALSGLAEQGFTLRIVGGDGHGADSIKATISHTAGAVFCGRLSDVELRREYERCCCLAYPSLWEGFGLPALEALSQDIPLLLADTGALAEVGGPFATYVDPCNPRSIANGLVAAAAFANSDAIGTPLAADRLHWQNKYTRSAYLAAVDEVVKAASVTLELRSGSDSDVLTDASAALNDPNPPAGTHRGKVTIRRRLQATLIRRSRILPATMQNVPGNSFSLDYLYCLQQERRLRLSRALARFMSGKIWMFPWFATRVIAEMVSLNLTNTLIRSLINEFVMQKLSARMERDHD